MLAEIVIAFTLIAAVILFFLLGQFYFLELMVVAAFFAGYSYFIERNSLEITRPEIKISCLKSDLDSKIALISDLHFNAKTSKRIINNLLGKIKEAKPEIVFITGDLIDKKNGVEVAGKFVSEISSFSKVYAVFGNWDYFVLNYNIAELKNELEKNKAVVLVNESKTIKIGDSQFDIIGIKDPFSSKNTKNDLEKAMASIKGSKSCKILLSHSPESIADASVKKIDLVLSGHTHGGQVYMPLITRLIIPAKFGFKKYIKGTYKAGDTALYINRGIGTSNLPFRFLNIPELTILNLKK